MILERNFISSKIKWTSNTVKKWRTFEVKTKHKSYYNKKLKNKKYNYEVVCLKLDHTIKAEAYPTTDKTMLSIQKVNQGKWAK